MPIFKYISIDREISLLEFETGKTESLIYTYRLSEEKHDYFYGLALQFEHPHPHLTIL